MKRSAAAELAILIFIALLFSQSVFAQSSSTVTAHFINVGQGDAALIRDSSGFDILIDGGDDFAGPTVVTYIRNQHLDDIDVLIATHADADHIGGLIDVLAAEDIRIEKVLYNGYIGDTDTWEDFTAAVAAEGIALDPVYYPAAFTWGETQVQVLNPVAGLTGPDDNEVSIVLLLRHGSIEYVFTGDIDAAVEATVAARVTPVAAEVLKVSHHGSKSSSSELFLQTFSPDAAVISVGRNPYGHPSEEVINRLRAIGAEVTRTDVQGDIQIISDGQSIITRIQLPANIPVFLPLLSASS
jgi:beta-lactamase superfamily II metal-dependent hydrolase